MEPNSVADKSELVWLELVKAPKEPLQSFATRPTGLGLVGDGLS